MSKMVFDMVKNNPQNFMLCANDTTWDKYIVNKKFIHVLSLNSKQYNELLQEFELEYLNTDEYGNNYYAIIEEEI
jgi:hypothetical protein